MNKVITISREYGSGGREIGEKLANELGVPFYDNELITRAAKASGFAESVFANAETKATNSLLYSIAMGMSAYGSHEVGYTSLSLDDRIFIAQSEVIRNLAKEGPCVIVGRCADYILKDMDNVINVFIWADIKYRVHRATTMYDLPVNKAEENIRKADKRRANYYNYHANEKWGKAENYHISIRSDIVGMDTSVDILKSYILSCK